GGVQVGTDFSLQPYLITAPLPSFIGAVTLPSKVDLYINGLKRYSGEVPAGPFELNTGINSVNGAGQAQIVMTDTLGQITTLNFPIYNTPRLLRQGLSEWSMELGVVRRGYGIDSFSYDGEPVLNAIWRRGLTDHFTLEAHGE